MKREQSSDRDRPPVPFGLVWAIKRSFVAYVRGMPDGQGALADGALPVDPDMLLFPLLAAPSQAVGTDERIWTFRGDVRFRAHGGMLFVRIAAPQLVLRGNRAELTIEDPYGRADVARMPLVQLHVEQGDAPPGARVWLGSEVRLTEQGAELFNGVYPPGEPFEQLSVIQPS